MADRTARLVLVPAGTLTDETAQTSGMRRRAALGERVGAASIWMGQTLMAPATASGAHHHGRSETCIYVVAGHPVFAFRDGDAVVRLQTGPGDYVYVPPYVVHVEENPAADEAVVVVARSTSEAIVENMPAL